jgi:hypothetical protein
MLLLAARGLTLARFSAQARIAETFPAYRRAGSLGENVDAGQECPAYQVSDLREITEDHFIG